MVLKYAKSAQCSLRSDYSLCFDCSLPELRLFPMFLLFPVFLLFLVFRLFRVLPVLLLFPVFPQIFLCEFMYFHVSYRVFPLYGNTNTFLCVETFSWIKVLKCVEDAEVDTGLDMTGLTAFVRNPGIAGDAWEPTPSDIVKKHWRVCTCLSRKIIGRGEMLTIIFVCRLGWPFLYMYLDRCLCPYQLQRKAWWEKGVG